MKDRGDWAKFLTKRGTVASVVAAEPKRSRFLAQGVRDEHGQYFHSKSELQRWRELLLLAHAGEISDLQRQVSYPLNIVGAHGIAHVGDFTPDFQYREHGILVIEDFKSPRTAKETAYRLRKQIFEALYGVTIRETLREWKR